MFQNNKVFIKQNLFDCFLSAYCFYELISKSDLIQYKIQSAFYHLKKISSKLDNIELLLQIDKSLQRDDIIEFIKDFKSLKKEFLDSYSINHSLQETLNLFRNLDNSINVLKYELSFDENQVSCINQFQKKFL